MARLGYRTSPLLSTLGIAAVAGAVAPACRDEGNTPPVDSIADVVAAYQDLVDFYCECYAEAYEADGYGYCSGDYQPYVYSEQEVACLDRVFDANPAAFEVMRCQGEALRSYVGCLRAQGCPATFECGDGSAVPEDFVCDGEADCANGSDEQQNCPPPPTCADGEPLDRWSVCDGFEDCADGSDEVDCPPPFACGDGTELPPQSVCNGFSECPDGEDEDQNCPVTCDSRYDEQQDACGDLSDEVDLMLEECFDFVCLSGLEIPREQVCDGTPDCPEGDDEDSCASMSAGG